MPDVLSEQWYKLTQANQEAEGFVRLSRHTFMNRVHAEQVMAEEFQARLRQNCGDRRLKLETREGLWRGQVQAVVKGMLSEVTLQNTQGVGALWVPMTL